MRSIERDFFDRFDESELHPGFIPLGRANDLLRQWLSEQRKVNGHANEAGSVWIELSDHNDPKDDLTGFVVDIKRKKAGT